ncbi:MAG: ComEC/Rec2 family competence protein [Puniceicoccales bacterium]|jgi:competence protein ComEC|nr:ComEC/Rec2 family competence protein [Puniceicoccales bacterium]
MNFLSPKHLKNLRIGAISTLFLPTLFFIAGIRLQKFSTALQFSVTAGVVLLVPLIIKRFGNVGLRLPLPARPSVRTIAMLAMSMVLGSLYYGWRCMPKARGNEGKLCGDAIVAIKANSVVVNDQPRGIFYGYGTIAGMRSVGIGGHADAPVGERIFFSVKGANGDEIPVVGQVFEVHGRLKFVRSGSGWWFLKHLENSHVRWHISDCFTVPCAGKPPPLGVIFRKISDRFVRSLAVGVEGRPTEVGILSGMLTGLKQRMDGNSRSMFNDLGIAHLFAVSGIHVGIIGMAINFFLKIFAVRKGFRTALTLVALAIYVNAVGCSPSAVRALTMVMFYHASTLLGRKPNSLSALTNSALLHAVVNPFVVFNISFLLSYSVVAGIILIGLPLKNFLAQIFLDLHGLKLGSFLPLHRLWFRVKGTIVTSIAVSTAAYFASLPLSIGYFGTMSLLTIPVNMVVVPIAACAIVAGAVALFFGMCGLWTLCAAVNKISCSLVFVFRLLAQCFHLEACCFRNIPLSLGCGAAMTMVLLIAAYAAVSRAHLVDCV